MPVPESLGCSIWDATDSPDPTWGQTFDPESLEVSSQLGHEWKGWEQHNPILKGTKTNHGYLTTYTSRDDPPSSSGRRLWGKEIPCIPHGFQDFVPWDPFGNFNFSGLYYESFASEEKQPKKMWKFHHKKPIKIHSHVLNWLKFQCEKKERSWDEMKS